jgi:3-oxoacyl-[acyl-carrier-protein] synthase-3
MTRPNGIYTRILGTGRAVPEKVLTNFDLERMVETTDAWITERTGIKERHLIGEGQVTSDLAAEAAKKAIEKAGLTPAEIDMIVLGTVTPDMPMPATAAFVQAKIGASKSACFDLSAACAGSLYGLAIADQFIRTGTMKRIVVIGVEVLSRVLDWTDRNTCVLFGDAAGAMVVGAGDPSDGPRGILSTHLYTDGTLAEALTIPGGGTREPASVDTVEKKRHKVHMNGREIFKAAVRNLSSSVQDALAANGKTVADVDVVIAHQANMRIIEAVSQRTELPLSRFHLNIDRFGNTSSASVPIALDEALEQGRIQSGHLVAMTALGAGISWGSALVRW